MKRRTIRAKRKTNTKAIDLSRAEKMLEEALKVEPKDISVQISLRLDGETYLELKRRAHEGAGDGKYQRYLNQLLRQALFGETATRSKR